MKSIIAAAFALTALLPSAHGEDVCEIVKGAVLIAQDDKNTYLGKIINSYDSESIFNEYGTYGSRTTRHPSGTSTPRSAASTAPTRRTTPTHHPLL